MLTGSNALKTLSRPMNNGTYFHPTGYIPTHSSHTIKSASFSFLISITTINTTFLFAIKIPIVFPLAVYTVDFFTDKYSLAEKINRPIVKLFLNLVVAILFIFDL